MTQSFPALEELVIKTFLDAPSLNPDGWLPISHLQALHTLEMKYSDPPSDGPLLRELSKLPDLRHLRLSVHHLMPAADSDHDLAFRGFATLQTFTVLILAAGTPWSLRDALPIFSSPSLSVLNVKFPHASNPPLLPAMLNHIANAYRALRCLSITGDFSLWHTQNNLAVDSFDDAFGQLLGIQTIEECTLHTSRHFVVCAGGDRELVRMAECWPKLRRLSLFATLSGPLTHRCLVSFARRSPGLRVLHLRSVRFSDLTMAHVSMIPRLGHGLEELGICNALPNPEDAGLDAAFIQRLFPRAQTTHACCGESSCAITMAVLTPRAQTIAQNIPRRPDWFAEISELKVFDGEPTMH
ncbi:hypothetical protein C2E23DRAFT_555027 [Lenzites betulinus]|nr:hypothetical protein C2E23DRAFT_555027 [Lenzites betulinus]